MQTPHPGENGPVEFHVTPEVPDNHPAWEVVAAGVERARKLIDESPAPPVTNVTKLAEEINAIGTERPLDAQAEEEYAEMGRRKARRAALRGEPHLHELVSVEEPYAARHSRPSPTEWEADKEPAIPRHAAVDEDIPDTIEGIEATPPIDVLHVPDSLEGIEPERETLDVPDSLEGLDSSLDPLPTELNVPDDLSSITTEAEENRARRTVHDRPKQ